VLVVAHRASLLAVADTVVEVRSSTVPSVGSAVPA
jgi:hypothetical protein